MSSLPSDSWWLCFLPPTTAESSTTQEAWWVWTSPSCAPFRSFIFNCDTSSADVWQLYLWITKSFFFFRFWSHQRKKLSISTEGWIRGVLSRRLAPLRHLKRGEAAGPGSPWSLFFFFFAGCLKHSSSHSVVTSFLSVIFVLFSCFLYIFYFLVWHFCISSLFYYSACSGLLSNQSALFIFKLKHFHCDFTKSMLCDWSTLFCCKSADLLLVLFSLNSVTLWETHLFPQSLIWWIILHPEETCNTLHSTILNQSTSSFSLKNKVFKYQK